MSALFKAPTSRVPDRPWAEGYTWSSKPFSIDMSNDLTLLIMLGHRRYGEGMPVTRIGRHGDFATSTERHMESFVQQRTSLIQTFVELGFRFLGGHKLPNVEEEERVWQHTDHR